MTLPSADSLAERAMHATGLSHFGPDGWQVGLEQLLDALEPIANHRADAGDAVAQMLVRRLASRLQVEAWYDGRGTAGLPPVEGPIVILGLPRSATTALHYLLARDPRFRFTRQWEMAAPVPPPDPETEATDPRRQRSSSRRNDVRHIADVDGPTEDVSIHALNFGSQEFALPVPAYRSWWRDVDLRTTFVYQERVLQLLHSRRGPSRWLLKAPAYLFHLPEMTANYPCARFVWTHRDPIDAVPSACSVILDAQKMVLSGMPEDRDALGAEVLGHFAEGIRRAMASRSSMDPRLFVDVGQAEVERDPVGTAERIYDHLGMDLGDDLKAAMSQWAAANQRGSRGVHRYSASEFGLTSSAIAAAFADYCEVFAGYLSPTSC